MCTCPTSARLAQQLRQRINSAREMVARTNAALAGRETSSGIEVKLEWVPRDGGADPLLDRALRLLTKDVQLLTESERTELTAFFRWAGSRFSPQIRSSEFPTLGRA
jgi:hypothetical protein